jgi:hypothetical protein
MSMAIGIIPVVGLSVSLACPADRPVERGPRDALLSQTEGRRTPSQQKINSHLLYEIARRRGDDRQKDAPPDSTDVRIDARGRALVDVRAVPVTPSLERKIRDLGGAVVSTSVVERSILAWVPLLKLERLAQEATVRFIEPAAEAITQRPSRGDQ